MASALLSFFVLALPALIYAAVQRRRGVTSRAIASRLGLRWHGDRMLALHLGIGLAVFGMTWWMSAARFGFFGENSPLYPFLGQRPSADLLLRAWLYAGVATGPGEELLFRGLIAGALFRRMPFWRANLLQALVFTAPHLLVLLVRPDLWLPGIVIPTAMGFVLGAMRHQSGSILGPALLHSLGNFGAALGAMAWG